MSAGAEKSLCQSPDGRDGGPGRRLSGNPHYWDRPYRDSFDLHPQEPINPGPRDHRNRSKDPHRNGRGDGWRRPVHMPWSRALTIGTLVILLIVVVAGTLNHSRGDQELSGPLLLLPGSMVVPGAITDFVDHGFDLKLQRGGASDDAQTPPNLFFR